MIEKSAETAKMREGNSERVEKAMTGALEM